MAIHDDGVLLPTSLSELEDIMPASQSVSQTGGWSNRNLLPSPSPPPLMLLMLLLLVRSLLQQQQQQQARSGSLGRINAASE